MDARFASEAYLSSALARFRPWRLHDGRSPQRDFLLAAGSHRVRLFRSGNQAGKTSASVVDALLRLLGWHPTARHAPPVWGWLSALDWEFGVGQVLWPKLRAFLPMSEVRSIAWYRRAEPSLPQTIVFRNGSRLDLKSADAGRNKYQGATLHFVGLDEEHPADVVEECRARLMRHGGDLWATLTPVRRERWVLDLEREPGTLVIRASTRDAARAGVLDANAVDAYADSLPDRQRAVRMEGDFAALEGLVYGEWDRGVHVVRPSDGRVRNAAGTVDAPWPPPPSWPRYAAIDFGYSHPTAVVVAAVDPGSDGLAVVERCYYAAHVRATEWARALKDVLPPLAAPLVSDHDAFERAELQAAGIDTHCAAKDIVPGIETVERFLKRRGEAGGRPRLVVAVDDAAPPRHALAGRCDGHYLAWELEAYRYPPGGATAAARDRPDLPLKRDDHACDALRYLCMFLERYATGAGAMLAPDLGSSPAGASATRGRDLWMGGTDGGLWP